jgi:hypothetical protein
VRSLKIKALLLIGVFTLALHTKLPPPPSLVAQHGDERTDDGGGRHINRRVIYFEAQRGVKLRAQDFEKNGDAGVGVKFNPVVNCYDVRGVVDACDSFLDSFLKK